MSELDKMSFIEDLSDVTGTEEVSGVVRLIDREIVGSSKFINSGVSLKRKLDESILDFDSTSNNIYDYFSFGSRFRPTTPLTSSVPVTSLKSSMKLILSSSLI